MLPVIIGIFNQKGGVGKTLLTSIMAEFAAKKLAFNVLVVDTDLQANSSDYWIGMEASKSSTGAQIPPVHPDYVEGDPSFDNIEPRSTIADTFFGKGILPYETCINPRKGDYIGKVDIILSHPKLLETLNSEFDNKSGYIETKILNRLKEVLYNEDVGSEYDLVILDTGPSRNPIFRSAIRCATHAIIPFQAEEKSIQGVNAMNQVISSENFSRKKEDSLKTVALVPNNINIKTLLHQSVLEKLYEMLPDIMCPKGIYLPQSIAFPERDVKGINPQSIFDITKKDHVAKNSSIQVCQYLFGKIYGEKFIDDKIKSVNRKMKGVENGKATRS